MNDPTLRFPDISTPFILTTDDSNFTICAILSQENIGTDSPEKHMLKEL